jgi:hypothetical protein
MPLVGICARVAGKPASLPRPLDGLLENDSVLRLREHSTDTRGYIEDLFGSAICCAIPTCRAFGT